MTRQILFAALAGIVSLLSLLGGSGIGQAYNLYPMTMLAVAALYAIGPIQRSVLTGQVRRRELFIFLGLVLIIGLWPMVKGYKTLGMEYGWLLLVPYVVGQLKMSQADVRAMGLVCGCFGAVVLIAQQYFGIFAGWNQNTIAMAGFLGCAVCFAAPWTSWGGKIFNKILLVVMTLLTLQLDSRSCLTGLLALLVFSFGFLKPRFFAMKPWIRRLMLIIPAVISVGTVLFQNSSLFDDLNALSMEYFSKPIFNGRNSIWAIGWNTVIENPFLGNGALSNGYWHNCAMTVMTAFGLVGYSVWLLYFENIMAEAQQWADDQCLQGCIVSFLVIMLQQSFELGLVSTQGSILPYFIIGIILGRIKYLKAHYSR